MRILLTLPPDIHRLEIYQIIGMKAPPLGLATIASVLENAGHKVKIIDSPTLELGIKEWFSEIKSWSPDIVGISLLTPTAPKGYRAIKFLKEEMGEDLPIIVGGPHPTFLPEEALSNGADVVVRGEGEITTLELIEVIGKHGLNPEKLSEVKGIAFKNREGEIVQTEQRPYIHDLDKIPWPARHLLPMDKYTLFGKPIRIAHIMASRGCPYGCMYCSTSYFWGRRIRIRSAKNVADEVEHIYNKYGIKQFVFTDDEFTLVRKFVYGFLDEIKERGLDIRFACGSRVDHVNKEMLKRLFDSGCTAIYFGIESGNQETLDRIHKRITLEQAERAIRWVKEVGGLATGSFILGFPWETIDDMKRTVEFAIKIDPHYAQFTALTPYPGTPLFQYAKENGLIEDWDWEHYTTIRAVMRGFNFTRKQLSAMVRYAYRKFYLRWGFIRREMRAGRLKDMLGILAKELFSWVRETVVHHIRWR